MIEDDVILAKIRTALAPHLPAEVDAACVHPDASLLDDLGLDSVTFVELAVSLEEQLAIEEFPLQDYVDGELGREAGRFSVRSLIAACRNVLAELAA